MKTWISVILIGQAIAFLPYRSLFDDIWLHGRSATRAVGLAVDFFFSTSNVTVIRAVTDARNLTSIRVHELAGFSFSSQQDCLFKGEMCTEYTYFFRKK